MSVPLSIPSPDDVWRSINVSQWLRDIGLEWFPGDLTLHAYALCILLGMVAAAFLTNRRLTARGAEPWIVLDIVLWAIPLGIIGARLFHVVTHPDDYFAGQNPIEILYIWNGGIAIFGGLIGGAIGAYIGCRSTGVRFTAFADALAPGLLLAQALGRVGNWFNRELFGLPTDLPWGLEIESDNPAFPVGLPEGTLFHPTFLYEVVWNLLGVAVLLYLSKKFAMQWGKLLAMYLIWYGAGRIVWESIRVDPSEVFFGLRSNVWAAIIAVLLGIIILVVQSRRHPGAEPSPYVAGREWSDAEPAVDSEETYSDSSDDSGNDAATTPDELAGAPSSKT